MLLLLVDKYVPYEWPYSSAGLKPATFQRPAEVFSYITMPHQPQLCQITLQTPSWHVITWSDIYCCCRHMVRVNY